MMTSQPNDPELVLNLQAQVRTQQSLLEAIKRDGLSYYRPHSKQDAFHRAGTFHLRGVFSGNRFGKSQMGCAEDCAWLRGERPWYPQGDEARTAGIPRHPVKGLVITTDWDKVDEIWTTQRGDKPGKIWKYLPADFVKSQRRNHSGAIDTIECTNGSLLRFDTVKSFMANPMGSESSDWDFIHVDEPCPEKMFKAAARGLIDRGGKAWFTLTPLSEPWITDHFTEGDQRNRWNIRGTIYDNTYLAPESIAEYERLLTEDEKQCRLMGIPLFLSGLVYKEFRPEIHVLRTLPRQWAGPLEPPRDWLVYYNIDPHPHTPHAVLFCAVSPLGQRFYYHDIFIHCTIASLCEKIKEVVLDRPVGGIRIDPIAYIEDPITGSTMAEEFHRCGVFCEKASKDLSGGILAVKASLSTQPQAIWFLSGCTRTLWEFPRYRWRDEGDNRPVDEDDHMMENLYRMELSHPRWFDMSASSVPVGDLVIAHTESLELDDVNADL